MAPRKISKCSVPGCGTRVTGQGLCNLHYRRMRRHGDPMGGRPTLKGEPLAFAEAAADSDTDDCIIWPYSKCPAGYGSLFLDGSYQKVTRVVLQKAKGEPPHKKMVAAHAPTVCHNPSCINPRHLRWATTKENLADTIIDGTRLLGEKTNSAKLTVAQVREIRKDARSDEEVAKSFCVSRRAIRAVRSRSTWGWLHD